MYFVVSWSRFTRCAATSLAFALSSFSICQTNPPAGKSDFRGASEADVASTPGSEFVEYVGGRDLGAWQGAVDSFEMRDGLLVCRPGKRGDLLTREEFANGVIQIEFRLPRAGNSGVALRTPLGGRSAKHGLEIQILDDEGYSAHLAESGAPPLKPYQYHGSLYFCVGATRGHLRPSGEWNFQEIRVEGNRITVTLNGVRILDVDTSTLDRSRMEVVPGGLDRTRGYVGIAGHGDPVEFRSFRVQRLGESSAAGAGPRH